MFWHFYIVKKCTLCLNLLQKLWLQIFKTEYNICLKFYTMQLEALLFSCVPHTWLMWGSNASQWLATAGTGIPRGTGVLDWLPSCDLYVKNDLNTLKPHHCHLGNCLIVCEKYLSLKFVKYLSHIDSIETKHSEHNWFYTVSCEKRNRLSS